MNTCKNLVGRGQGAPLKLNWESSEECCNDSVLKLPILPRQCVGNIQSKRGLHKCCCDGWKQPPSLGSFLTNKAVRLVSLLSASLLILAVWLRELVLFPPFSGTCCPLRLMLKEKHTFRVHSRWQHGCLFRIYRHSTNKTISFRTSNEQQHF